MSTKSKSVGKKTNMWPTYDGTKKENVRAKRNLSTESKYLFMFSFQPIIQFDRGSQNNGHTYLA